MGVFAGFAKQTTSAARGYSIVRNSRVYAEELSSSGRADSGGSAVAAASRTGSAGCLRIRRSFAWRDPPEDYRPDGGDQPIVSGSGDTVIVFNGEIYNHAELRAELERRGRRFRTRTRYRDRCWRRSWNGIWTVFARLRGMFAIALWTESRSAWFWRATAWASSRFICAHVGGDLYFGSELKAILIHPEIERRLSMQGLDCFLSLNYVPCPWTLVEGVEKLPPGRGWNGGTAQCGRTRTGRCRSRARPVAISAAAQEGSTSLLRQSVREHLISDVPLGVWLSGGVDSSTILHYAAEDAALAVSRPSPPFQGRSFDESGAIQRDCGSHMAPSTRSWT